MSRIYLILPSPCLPSFRNYSTTAWSIRMNRRGERKRTNQRSFPMKIRRGRSGKLFVLPFPSLHESNFCFTTVYIYEGEERIFLFPQRRPKVGTKFKLAQTSVRPRLHVIAKAREITLISRVAALVVICRWLGTIVFSRLPRFFLPSREGKHSCP